MLPRSPILALVVLLGVGLAFSPAVANGCPVNHPGGILLAFPSPIPPPVTGDSLPGLQGILVYQVAPVLQGQAFWLYAAAGNDPVLPCVEDTCLYVPDFSVAFFRAEGELVHTQTGATYADPGPIEGDVPLGADYALVWMRAGVDVVGTEPLSGEFFFSQGCTARPW